MSKYIGLRAIFAINGCVVLFPGLKLAFLMVTNSVDEERISPLEKEPKKKKAEKDIEKSKTKGMFLVDIQIMSISIANLSLPTPISDSSHETELNTTGEINLNFPGS